MTSTEGDIMSNSTGLRGHFKTHTPAILRALGDEAIRGSGRPSEETTAAVRNCGPCRVLERFAQRTAKERSGIF